jgi:hypothetical protein
MCGYTAIYVDADGVPIFCIPNYFAQETHAKTGQVSSQKRVAGKPAYCTDQSEGLQKILCNSLIVQELIFSDFSTP